MSKNLHKVTAPPMRRKKATVPGTSALLAAVSLLTVSLGVLWVRDARGEIKGESQDDKHKDWVMTPSGDQQKLQSNQIKLHSKQIKLQSNQHKVITSKGTGKVQDISVTKRNDKASPNLMQSKQLKMGPSTSPITPQGGLLSNSGAGGTSTVGSPQKGGYDFKANKGF